MQDKRRSSVDNDPEAKRPKTVFGSGELLPSNFNYAYAPPPPQEPPSQSSDIVENKAEDEHQDEAETATDAVQLLLMEAVEELSVVARALEKWTVFVPSIGVSEEQRLMEKKRYDEAVKKGKSRIAEHLRRFMRKSRRLMDTVKGFDEANIPVDLISHVDCFLSPNTWLRALYDEIEYENAVARGELSALGAFQSTLMFYMEMLDYLHEQKLIKVPDFSEAFLAPTALRKPVLKSDMRVDLVQILAMLKTPIAPTPLGQDLRFRPS